MKITILFSVMFILGQYQVPFRTFRGPGSPTPPATNPIAASRQVDWTKAGVVGGIPARTAVCSTLSPGVSAATIISAIASCPSGGVVSLAAGTYNLSAGIDFASHSNVTLRGAGANQTFLVFSGSFNCHGFQTDVCVEGDGSWSGGPANTATWSAGYSPGTTQITLSSTSNLAIGNMLILDQANDSSDTGNVWVCETQGVCSSEGPAGGGRSGRTQEQIVQVQAVNGNTVTISPGLYMPNWRSSQSPGAWWSTTDVQSDGIEDLSMDHSASNQQSGMVFFNAINCWAKGIRSLNGNRNHVWFYQSAHNTIADSYFYGTLNAASQSYGVEDYMAFDNLIENSIFQHITSPTMNNGPSSGNVIAYNYSTDDYYSVSANWMMASAWFHSAGTSMNLYEGNVGTGYTGDDTHGTHNFETAFRNYYIGWETGKSNQTSPVLLYAGSRYFNLVGNVFGKAGYHNNYQSVAPNSANYTTSIYGLGWSGNGSTGSFPNDPNVANTLMRWGNYDVVNGSAQFNSSEVPSSDPNFPNPVPATQNLPASMYLIAQPSWWTMQAGFGTTPPFPATGPDVTGGTGPGGHSYEIPAELCFDHLTGGPPLTFNASSCYVNP